MTGSAYFYLLWLILLLGLPVNAAAQHEEDSTLEHDAILLIAKAEEANLTKAERKQVRKYVYKMQNKGFKLAEQDHNYLDALIETDKALQIWVSTRDSSNEANNRKYRGYLLGKLGRYSEAKQEIAQAIRLFSMLNMDFGVAVSYFDLAHVYAAEGKIDSALVFAYANLEYWSTRNDTGRIGGAHCLLAYLYSLDGNYKEAKKFIAQNEMLLLTSDVHWQLKLDQLYLGTIVYSESDESDLAHKYKDQYDRLVEELKTKHIKARTQY